MEEVTRILARYVVESRFESIPAATRQHATRTFVNWLGCAIGGSHHEGMDIALAALAPMAGAAQASVLGRSERLDILHAALLKSQAFSGGPTVDRLEPEALAAAWPAARFAPATYEVLADALLDWNLAADLGGGDLQAAAGRFRADTHLLGYDGDQVFTLAAQARLGRAIRRAGGFCRERVLPGSHGHDSFLAEPETLAPYLRTLLMDNAVARDRIRAVAANA